MPTVGFSQAMICQHLDDICAAAEAKGELDAFDAAFMEAAKELGVKLAPRDDCEKTFAPCRRGGCLAWSTTGRSGHGSCQKRRRSG